MVVVDSRKTFSMQKVFFSQDLSPHVLDRLDLGEETVAANIEVITFVVHRPGQSAYNLILLEHDRLDSSFTQFISSGESGGTGTNHYYLFVRVLEDHDHTSRSRVNSE